MNDPSRPAPSPTQLQTEWKPGLYAGGKAVGARRQPSTPIYPSLLAGLYFMVLQIRRVAPRIKMHHLDPSIDTNIKIVRRLELYRMMFKEWNWKKKQLPIAMFMRKKTLFFLVGEALNYSYIFAYRGWAWILTAVKRESCLYHYQHCRMPSLHVVTCNLKTPKLLTDMFICIYIYIILKIWIV